MAFGALMAMNTGVAQTSARANIPTTTNRDGSSVSNRIPAGREEADGENDLSPFGGGGQPVQHQPVQERPERQKLREQRVQQRPAEQARQETTSTDRQVRTDEGQPQESPRTARQNRLLEARFKDNTWTLQARYDSQMQQSGANPTLSEVGKRRMQALHLNNIVNDCYHQHTGGKADEAYSRSQYRQILGALSSLNASTTPKSSRNDGTRSSEPNTPASLGRKMNDATRIAQIFEPPPNRPEGEEPLEIIG